MAGDWPPYFAGDRLWWWNYSHLPPLLHIPPQITEPRLREIIREELAALTKEKV